MNISNKYFYTFVLSFTAAAFFILILEFILCSSRDLVQVDCSSNLIVDSDVSDFHGELSTFMFIEKNTRGYMDVSGIVRYHNHEYNVERSYRFNYSKNEDDIYHLTNITISKRGIDNVNNEVMSKLFLSPDIQHGRYIQIKKQENVFLISSLYSPFFLCIPK